MLGGWLQCSCSGVCLTWPFKGMCDSQCFHRPMKCDQDRGLLRHRIACTGTTSCACWWAAGGASQTGPSRSTCSWTTTRFLASRACSWRGAISVTAIMPWEAYIYTSTCSYHSCRMMSHPALSCAAQSTARDCIAKAFCTDLSRTNQSWMWHGHNWLQLLIRISAHVCSQFYSKGACACATQVPECLLYAVQLL